MKNSVDYQTQILTWQDQEAAVLKKAALKLEYCVHHWGATDHERRLDDALRFNQSLWSIFRVSLSREQHPLRKELRNDLLLLSIFVTKRTFDLTAYPSAEKVNVLIAINRNIAAGLKRDLHDGFLHKRTYAKSPTPSRWAAMGYGFNQRKAM
jgi:flagellar protein FlaF